MLAVLNNFQLLVLIVLWAVAFGCEAYALTDAARQRADAFTAAGKLTKNKWLAILAVAAAFGFLSMPWMPVLQTLGFLSLAGAVAAVVYLVDVRPALRRMTGGGYRQW